MQYLLVPDKYHPTHTAPNGLTVRVQQFADNVRIQSPYPVRKDLAGYTVLPAQTPQQKDAADVQRTLDAAKQRKLDAIEKAYDADLAAGISVLLPGSNPAVNLVLAAGDSDQQSFAHGLVLVNTAGAQASDQNAFVATMVSTIIGRTIADAAGNQHDMSVAQYRQLILAYGQAIGSRQGALAAKRAAVNSATTVAAVNAV